MPNSAGMLKESIWRDPDWRRLPRAAQATYAQLLSQKELDRAGMLPLQVSKWAKGCDEVTEDALRDDLKLLEARRFVFVDEDTDELFVRSYMRHSEVTKYPQYLKSATRCARLVGSLKLRRELAAELRRLRVGDAVKAANEIDPDGTVPEPSPHPDVRVPEPSPNPSVTVNGSGTLPEPCRGGERVGVVTSLGGSVGEPPPKFCDRHPNGTDDKCGACGIRRKARDAWDEQHVATLAAAEAERRLARARELADCTGCDEYGWVLDENRQPIEPAVRCRHDSEPAHA
jgi:hypothetical protein